MCVRVDLEVTGGVDEQVGGLQVAVQHVGRVDVLQASQDLVEEVADVVVAQLLGLQQLVEVRLHQSLHDVAGGGGQGGLRQIRAMTTSHIYGT